MSVYKTWLRYSTHSKKLRNKARSEKRLHLDVNVDVLLLQTVQGSSCGMVNHKGIVEKEPALSANLPWIKVS